MCLVGSVLVLEFDKHPKKAGGHIGRNVVEITIKVKTVVRKPLMIKMSKISAKNYSSIYIYIYMCVCVCVCVFIYE